MRVLCLSVFPERGRLPRVRNVHVSEDWIRIDLRDGSQLRLPTAWSPALLSATAAERERWYLVAGETAVRWPQAGELLTLRPIDARRPAKGQEAIMRGAGGDSLDHSSLRYSG